MNVSRINIAIKNSLSLFLTLLMQEMIQIGVMNAVKTINKIEIPSIPNLNFINPLIQFCSSINWKPVKLLSKEYHKKIVKNKFTILVNKERLIAFLFSFFSLLENKINKAPRVGSKVIDESIGKFILFNH